MVEFSEGKFILCRELFLTKSSVNRVEKSIPFCDRGVFRMFISSTASCTYKNYEILRKYVSAARRQYRHTKKEGA